MKSNDDKNNNNRNDNNNNNDKNNENNTENNNNVKPVTAPTTSSHGPLLPPVCGTTDAMYEKIVNTAESSESQFFSSNCH